MKSLLRTTVLKHPLRSGLVIFAGVATVIGCGYSLLTDHSVRFNEHTGRAFYRLPPLPLMYDSATGREISANQFLNHDYDNEDSYEERQKRDEQTVAETDAMWSEASQAIGEGNLVLAKARLEQFITKTELTLPEYSVSEEHRQRQRNTATDMLDAIEAIKLGSKTQAVKSYLEARRQYDDSTSPINVGDLRSRSLRDRNLDDNWVYLEGAVAYKSGDKEAAGERFHHLYARYPQSEKREAALYMKAKIAMETSYSFDSNECGFSGEKLDPYYVSMEEAETETAESTPSAQVDEKCRDGKWVLALQTFRSLIASYPNGRYVDDSHGWIAFIHGVGGQRAEALAEYYRLLGHPTSWKVRLEAKKSLQILGHHYDDETLDRVEEILEGDVNGAMAYAYHRIYNEAVDYTYHEMATWRYPDGDWSEREKEKGRVDKLHDTGKHELERVVTFATKMMQRYPRTGVSGGFVARIAEAQLELQNFDEAAKLAARAMELGVAGDLRAQALWVKGSGEHHGRRFAAAGVTFKRLLAEFPQSKYAEGSRRLLAMIAEDRGDLETALEMYFELGYETDVAYFLDVLLPTDRLAKFVGSHKSDPKYDQMLYGLGVRYMRERKWNDARAVLRRVRTENGVDEYLSREPTSTTYFSKEPVYHEDKKLTFVKASWVMQDLKTIDVLEHHQQMIEMAEGDEARAEAMYQLASAYYEADDLAFYNPAAWGGGRIGSLNQVHFTDHQRQPQESQIILEHMHGHDPLAHAIPIYEEIVTRFPQTKAAQDSLYSIAVAHERLSNRNGTWYAAYRRGLFPGPRVVSYSDVTSIYPGYQLPRGTYGWKPSSRTVNGGPGWAASEKPAPRLSRPQKIKREMRWAADKMKGTMRLIGAELAPKIERRFDTAMSWYTLAVKIIWLATIGVFATWCYKRTAAGPILRRVIQLGYVYTQKLRARRRISQVILELPRSESRVDRIIGGG